MYVHGYARRFDHALRQSAHGLQFFLALRHIHEPDIARHLNIQPDDFVYHHCRTRCLDGLPIVIEYTYMPLDLVPGLKKSQLYQSVYAYLRDVLGYKISSFHRIIRAVAATEEEAERLEVAAGSPLLELEQVGFLDDGTPFEYSVSRNVGDRSELRDISVV